MGGGAWRVIHVVPPGGGGVDRCVRDIVSLRQDDRIAHVSESQWVLEHPGHAEFTPLAPSAFEQLAVAGALGGPLVLHAHSTVAPVREFCERIATATGASCVLTLHDVWFADARLDARELSRRLAFVKAAAARTAPSEYIVDRVRVSLGAEVSCARIANGAALVEAVGNAKLELSTAAEAACRGAGFPVCVIGAIGEHKGLDALESVVRELPADMRVVLLGYTGRQLNQGWAIADRLWVHGGFEPAELPALVRRYGARIAFFPPGMPESYCYALSDAWMSGLTALAPDHGALAERIRQHGGGALYELELSPPDLAARLAAATVDAVPSHRPVLLRQPLPTLEGSVQALNALYRQHVGDSELLPADDAALKRLAQRHLNSGFCRREVLDLQRALEDSARASDVELGQLKAALNDAAVRQEAMQSQLAAQAAELAAARALGDQWQARYALLVQRLGRPLAWLPERLRVGAVRAARRLLKLPPRQ